MKRITIVLALLACVGSLQAETRYVTDKFKITLRTGESSSNKILKMLPSGTPLELLESNPETGYSRVKTRDGTQGFVLTRQLDRIPSARQRLQEAQKRLEELQQAPEQLSSQLASLQSRYSELEQQHRQLQRQKVQLEQELQGIKRTAANAVRIANERSQLRTQVASLTRQVEDLKQENRELRNESSQQWFLIGAGVISGGILLGLILPHLRFRRRKSSWGSL